MRKPVFLLLLPGILAVLLIVWCLQYYPDHLVSLLRWDALWYESIRADGYHFEANAKSNTGFFPLFSYLWRWLNLSPAGISVLNGMLMLGTTYGLARQLRLWWPAVWLFVALPTSLFFYVPYTEALFYAASGLVVLGLARQRPALVAAGLLLGGIVRPSALYFLPAAVGLGLVEIRHCPAEWRRWLGRSALYLASAATGIGLVVLGQWYSTGIWLAYVKTQLHWGHTFKLPVLPLTSVSQGIMLLDAMALVAGLALGGWLLWVLIQRQRPAPEVIFAAGFVVATVLNTLLYAPLLRGSTSLISVARYVFCTPFCLLLLHFFLPRQRPSGLLLAATAAAGIVLTLLLGLWQMPVLNFRSLPGIAIAGPLLALLLLGYTLLWAGVGYRLVRFSLYSLNILLLLVLLRNYLLGYWVG
ncbi:hypothetical protein [Hymenobacter sediminicola]|uniref:Glycosyltransferase family 39 protein n=1 Tax=Hymenobacter sediminicola TaxID=2761579 RepID=A0A7G7W8I9_9BACT|nr:hypothetical protein [Hymenobacter sediminicola]QNH62682.1 hypothetical protein H4317_02320 [Hymenobacter sediminicola]